MAPDSQVREIAFDCLHFLGDRPCVYHKRHGVVCRCDHYQAITERVLLIKLDAMGDVLRTTALLPLLHKEHPGSKLTWLTRPDSVPLLVGNPHVAEILALGADTPIHLAARAFDRVINLDAGEISASLAALARSPRKDGFVLEPAGVVRPTNEAAMSWLRAGLFDDIKRHGTETYQVRMLQILGAPQAEHGYIFELTDKEWRKGRDWLIGLGVDLERPIVGINTGAGARWPLKQWREDGMAELIDRLTASREIQVLLLGGPSERPRNERLRGRSPAGVFDAGCDHPVRDFAAILGHSTVVVTGDTLAMHLSLALRRRTIVLFGPTSAAEIELYGLGEKVVPDMSCLTCYKTACDFVPNCMDLISVDMVEAAVRRQLTIAGRPAIAMESLR
jgi:heptosyltransferase-2